jgi:molecular chaperone DnaK
MAVVGIDLGTTNTVVACARAGRVQVLADDQGRRLLPSVVSFHTSGEVLVGYPAKERRVVDGKNTIASVKRLIGRGWHSEELKLARERFPFDLKEGLGQGPLVVARDQPYTLPEISAFVLQRAKQISERALGERVDRAVITVPANFNELQRAATKVAGRIAGLDVIRIVNEPTAAALAYGFGRANKERIAVYDFGGGTFDCTLLELSGNVFEVLATAGDSYLGGDDIDLAIAERMANEFLRKHRTDPRTHPQAFERLRVAAESLKIELSSLERAHVQLSEVDFGTGGAPLGLDFSMSRIEFDALAAPLVERTFAVCEEALSIARVPPTSFDRVILVGGSTRALLVHQRVERFFGTPPLDRVNPEEVVAIGAAIQAAALTEAARRRSIPPPPKPRGRSPSRPPPDDEATLATQLSDQIAGLHKPAPPPSSVPPSPRSLQKPGALPPPLKPSPLRPPPPAPSSPVSSTLLDAHGPSSSAPPSSGEPRSVAPSSSASQRPRTPVLVDVTPRALVVETVGGWCDVIVQRNAKIPCERTRAFTTSSDMQTGVRVRVAQGEDAFFGNNTLLGEVELVGLRPAARGQVTIQVRFEVDESGTLKVFATDVATGREAHALLQLVGIAGAQSVAAMQVRHAAAHVR